MPPDKIGFKRVECTASVHMGPGRAEPERHPFYHRNMAVKNIMRFSRARDEGQVREFVETSITVGHPYALDFA
jgi:hypothetical protein